MTTLQIGRRLAVVLVVVTILSSTVIGFTAATTDTTSATQLDGNESAEAVATDQSNAEVATTVEQVGTTSADVTTGVEEPSTPTTTQTSPDETASTEAPTSAEPATEPAMEPVTTTAPTTTSAASDPTAQESPVETAETSSNEQTESTSKSTEQPTDEPATSTEATVSETPTETPLEATTEVPSVESSPDTSVAASVEADVESATTRTVDESTTSEQSAIPTITTTDDAVDSESATTAVPNLTDAVATVEDGQESVANDDTVVAPLTDSTETTQPDVDKNQPVADTTVPAPDDSPESIRTVTSTTETSTSIVDTGELFEEPTGSVTADQPTETVTAPVDTHGDDENASGHGPSNATATVGDSVDTIEDEIESEQVNDANETIEHVDDVATDTSDNADTANETFEPSVEPIVEPIDEPTAAATSVEERDEDGDESLDLTSNETTKSSLDSMNETADETIESASSTVTENDANTSVEPLFEESADEINVSSIGDSSVVTNGSDQESTSLADVGEFEPIDEISDELIGTTDDTVNGTVDSTANTVESVDPTFEEPIGEVNVSSIDDSTALDDSVAVANESGDEFSSLDAIDGSEALNNITNESSGSTDETVDGTVDSTANTVESVDPTFEEPVDVNLSSSDDLTAVTNESEDEYTSLDTTNDSEVLGESTNELTNATTERVAGTVDSATNTVAAVEPIFEDPADEVSVSTIDDSTVVTSKSGEEPAPPDEIGDFEPLEEVSNESTDVTDETVDGTIDSTANTVESIEPTFDESADEVNLSSLDGSVVDLTSNSDSLDGVADGSTDVTGQANDLTHVLENDAAEDVIGTSDETTNVATDSTASVIESAEPLFEDSDDATVASLDDALTVTDGSADELTSLDGVTDEPAAITGQTDELTDVLESDAVEDVTGTTTDATVTDLDGSVDPSLVQLEEIASDTVESSTVTTGVESRTTDLVVTGTEAASETLESGDSLVTEADGTIDDGTESAGELTDVRIEPLDETVYATDDLAGTVEDTDRIVSDFDSTDATADVERVGAIGSEISIDGTVEGAVGDLTVETSEQLAGPTDDSIDGTLTEAEQNAGRIVGSASTVDGGATTFEVNEITSAPSSQESTLSVGLVRAVDVDGRTPVASSRPESVADPIDSEPTAAVPHADASRTGGAITTAETVSDGSVEWVDSPSTHSKLHGDHSVARSTDDGSAAGPAVDSGQSNRPVEGESSPLDESESKAVLGLAAIAVGAAAGRFAGNASSLQAALNPSMVQLQLRAGAHSIQCWCDRFSFPRIGPIPGYSRYDDSDPLENEIRMDVYESIEGSPGVYLTRLSEESAVSRSTVRYHVRILESEGLISAVKVRGRRRFFLADSDETELATALSDDATAAVLDAVAQLEPASGSRIAERLDRDPSTASHHLKRLSEAGLVVREREGGAVLNRLSPTARETLTASNLRSAPREAKA